MNKRTRVAAVLATAAIAFPISTLPVHAAALEAIAQAAAGTAAANQRDASVLDGVKSVLSNDPALNGAQIAISAQDGLVTLAGVVLSEEQRVRAEQLTAAVEGVRGVENALEIVPET